LGIFECDESYFGGVCKGKRGRGAAGKVCVFGILKRGGKVYIIAGGRLSGLSSYTILDVSGFKHHSVNPSQAFFAIP